MDKIVHYSNCPVCGSSDINPALSAKDYTVSGKSFAIYSCSKCTLRFTQDIPDEVAIQPYYKSETYISHTDTSKGFINRLYHMVRSRTLVRKRKLIIQTTGIDKGKHLDIGAGTGAFIHEMKNNGWQSEGLEPDPDARKIGKEKYGIDLWDMKSFYDLPVSSFDAISLWHVLEHVHELHAYIEQLRSLLKDNGRIHIAVPNYTSLDAKIYQQFWAAYDVPRHLYHFSPASINTLVEKHRMKVVAYYPMWYDSFYISLLSSQYKNEKSSFTEAFWTGMRSNMKTLLDTKKCSSVIYVIAKTS